MSPPSVCTVIPVMPGPRLWCTSTGTPSPCCSHEARSTPEGLERCALTLALVIVANGWSSADAIRARQGVMRVQARSVSPAAYDARRRSSARMGRAASAASVMRRWARRPTGSSATSSGAVPGHHTTTGASGTSSGSTTDDTWCESGPRSRSSASSPSPSEPPTVISASSWAGPRPGRGMAVRMRQGCSRAASAAARTASAWVASSAMITRVSTRPTALEPCRNRSAEMALSTAPAVVFSSRTLMAASRPGRRARACRGRTAVPRCRTRTARGSPDRPSARAPDRGSSS